MNEKPEMPLANHHISVDCVVVGFDGEQLKVLLLKRTIKEDGEESHDMKLPGSLIYEDEDLDAAAQRVLVEQAGIRRMPLIQFKAFGSRDRTKNVKDVKWLERAIKMKVERAITIAYLSLVKISPHTSMFSAGGNELCWVPVNEPGELAFDHNIIIEEAMNRIRQFVSADPIYLFHLLPSRFTALQLRTLFERIYCRELDVRNFQKKLKQMKYVVPLDEYEKNVAHRAARYYRFDKVGYNKWRR
ncbi:MAG: NrtR DNA-binding winged helix domain-containing protein [Muribaculaceae bacterium]